MIDFETPSLEGFLTLEPHEAEQFGLPFASHGLLLVREEDGSQWSVATADVEIFPLILAGWNSGDVDFERVMLRSTQYRLIFGWPAPGVGFAISPPTFERD